MANDVRILWDMVMKAGYRLAVWPIAYRLKVEELAPSIVSGWAIVCPGTPTEKGASFLDADLLIKRVSKSLGKPVSGKTLVFCPLSNLTSSSVGVVRASDVQSGILASPHSQSTSAPASARAPNQSGQPPQVDDGYEGKAMLDFFGTPAGRWKGYSR